jgi:hypothetical protein
MQVGRYAMQAGRYAMQVGRYAMQVGRYVVYILVRGKNTRGLFAAKGVSLMSKSVSVLKVSFYLNTVIDEKQIFAIPWCAFCSVAILVTGITDRHQDCCLYKTGTNN